MTLSRRSSRFRVLSLPSCKNFLMAFEDLFPFKEQPPTPREHEIAPSAQVAGEARRDPLTPDFVGHKAIYRMAFRSMEVPGFPDGLKVGPVDVFQARGPIWTQRTLIQQRPGWRPLFVKTMEYVRVGETEWLTIYQRTARVLPDLARAIVVWRDQTLAVAGFVSAVLDERVAQELLVEDILVFNSEESEVSWVVDHVARLRTFQSTNRLLAEHRERLEAVGREFDLDEESPAIAAARWYLRGAQLGPVADAIAFFWIALEALAKPPYGTKLSGPEKSRSDVAWVEMAVDQAGVDPASVSPSVGRLAGLRAEVVHGGVEEPELLHVGYYALEQLVRLLLRYRLGGSPVGWPLTPERSNLRPPLRWLAERLRRSPQTRWEAGS